MRKPYLFSPDGRTVKVGGIIGGGASISLDDARDLAVNLLRIVTDAHGLSDRHQRHVNLMGHCPLCVYEARGQTDRLTYDESED